MNLSLHLRKANIHIDHPALPMLKSSAHWNCYHYYYQTNLQKTSVFDQLPRNFLPLYFLVHLHPYQDFSPELSNQCRTAGTNFPDKLLMLQDGYIKPHTYHTLVVALPLAHYYPYNHIHDNWAHYTLYLFHQPLADKQGYLPSNSELLLFGNHKHSHPFDP